MKTALKLKPETGWNVAQNLESMPLSPCKEMCYCLDLFGTEQVFLLMSTIHGDVFPHWQLFSVWSETITHLICVSFVESRYDTGMSLQSFWRTIWSYSRMVSYGFIISDNPSTRTWIVPCQRVCIPSLSQLTLFWRVTGSITAGKSNVVSAAIFAWKVKSRTGTPHHWTAHIHLINMTGWYPKYVSFESLRSFQPQKIWSQILHLLALHIFTIFCGKKNQGWSKCRDIFQHHGASGEISYQVSPIFLGDTYIYSMEIVETIKLVKLRFHDLPMNDPLLHKCGTSLVAKRMAFSFGKVRSGAQRCAGDGTSSKSSMMHIQGGAPVR